MCNKQIVEMTQLNKTWIIDLDGTIVKHNGYKIDGYDSLLKDVDKLLNQINCEDMVIIITSRSSDYKEMTEKFLKENNIKYNYIIYNAPYGERILINDRKPSGLDMSFAFNTDRDEVLNKKIERKQDL